MLRLPFTIITSTALILFISAVCCTTIGAQPHGAVTDSVWDYGYLPQKAEVSHVFYLYNIGDKSLNVEKIDPGCACTSVSEIDKPIKPGDSVAVEVTFKSGRYHGNVKKTTKVYTDDPVDPVKRLKLLAHVVKRKQDAGAISINPWEIVFDDADTLSSDLSLSNKENDTLVVSVAHNSAQVHFDIQPDARLLPGDELTIPMAIENRPDGSDDQALSITFDLIGEKTTRLTIPVKLKD